MSFNLLGFAPARRLAVPLLCALIAGGCFRRQPVEGAVASKEYDALFEEPTDTTHTSAVVVRDYWRSPVASVVAFEEEQRAYGIRGEVRLDGTLVHDHQFYISTYHFPNWASFAKLTAWNRNLESEGLAADVHSCVGNKGCTPYRSLRFRLPDSLLRASREGITLTFVGVGRPDVDILLRRDLIASYLDSLDAVSALRRRKIAAQH